MPGDYELAAQQQEITQGKDAEMLLTYLEIVEEMNGCGANRTTSFPQVQSECWPAPRGDYSTTLPFCEAFPAKSEYHP